MDSFLITLLVVAIAEMGDRTQLLSAVLAMRFKNDKAIIFGLLLATLINCALSAYLGSAIKGWISMDALKLFVAIAYIMGGVGMLLWYRPIDLLENWKIGTFATSFLGIFILQIGDKSQFIIGANAAQADHWIFPFFGAIFGIMIANVPAIIFKEELSNIIPLKSIRQIGGIVITIWGIIMAMQAFRIIG